MRNNATEKGEQKFGLRKSLNRTSPFLLALEQSKKDQPSAQGCGLDNEG